MATCLVILPVALLLAMAAVSSESAVPLPKPDQIIGPMREMVPATAPAGPKIDQIPTKKTFSKLTTGGNNNNISYETKWFTQLTDHFSWTNQKTWSQRYLVNKDHWCGANCPILFYTGNEGDIELFTNNTGWMWENAPKLKAMLVFAEHRFYGKSMPCPIDPTKVDPGQTKCLGYLTSEQALADYARLVFALKNNLFDAKHSPVITLGGSYGGMLAAWMRMKYPSLVAGALAGSAPILQFPGEYDCEQFYKVTTKDYEGYSDRCSRSISLSWQAIRNMVGHGADGLAKLSELFNLCKPLANDKDVDTLNIVLNGIWVNMAMTDYANEATFLSRMPAHPVEHACEHLKQDPVDMDDDKLLAAISNAAQVYTNFSKQASCLNMDTYTSDPMDVMWDFQSCTEMVMPICSNGLDDMFDPVAFNLTSYIESCRERWSVNTQVDKIQTMYGDKSLASASQIIFSKCTRDPWSAGCPQTGDEQRDIFVLTCPGAHHEDLRQTGPNDSAEMKQVRQQELDIVTKWIQKHYDNVRKSAPAETLVWATKTTSD